MGKDTTIEYADSSLNVMMGCDGCELWNKKTGVLHCYAGAQTERYGGRKGWPDVFESPKLFLERLDEVARWPSLLGKQRVDKPWLNGLPRIVFLNDMGDTFTESLDLMWFEQVVDRVKSSPHIYLVLTKRPERMLAFSRKCPLPVNIWPGVSITSQANANRLVPLLSVKGGGKRWLSVEPLLGNVDLSLGRTWCRHCEKFTAGSLGQHCKMDEQSPCFRGEAIVGDMIDWIVIGGESGNGARPTSRDDIKCIVEQGAEAGCHVFVKQLGSVFRERLCAVSPYRLDDILCGPHKFCGDAEELVEWNPPEKGGSMRNWPSELMIRHMPGRMKT